MLFIGLEDFFFVFFISNDIMKRLIDINEISTKPGNLVYTFISLKKITKYMMC